MGAAEPEMLAHRLALLMESAIVAAMVTRDPGAADTAGFAAGSLYGKGRNAWETCRCSEWPSD